MNDTSIPLHNQTLELKTSQHAKENINLGFVRLIYSNETNVNKQEMGIPNS